VAGTEIAEIARNRRNPTPANQNRVCRGPRNRRDRKSKGNCRRWMQIRRIELRQIVFSIRVFSRSCAARLSQLVLLRTNLPRLQIC